MLLNFHRLITEHDQLDALTARLEALCRADTLDVPAVMDLRGTLAADIAQHLADEDSFIYPHMIGGGNERVAAEAQAFVDEFDELVRDWGVYLADWDADRVRADESAFRDATLAIAARVRTRVRRENEQLYPLALRTGAIRLRAA